MNHRRMLVPASVLITLALVWMPGWTNDKRDAIPLGQWAIEVGDRSFVLYKVYDPVNGRIRVAYADGESGETVAPEEVMDAAAAVDQATAISCGKLDPSLCQRVKLLPAGERWPVVVWIKEGDVELATEQVRRQFPTIEFERGVEPQAATRSEAKAVAAAFRNAMKVLNENILGKAVTQLRESGVTGPLRYRRIAPIILGSLTVSEIYLAAKLPIVTKVADGGFAVTPNLFSASRTSQTKRAWDSAWGGSQALIALVDCGRVDWDHPNLAPLKWGSRSTTQAKGEHATLVAGAIGNTSSVSSDRGVAFASKIMSATIDENTYCNQGSTTAAMNEAIDATLWAVDHGAEALNISVGFSSETPMIAIDQVYDYVVYRYGVPVTASAGNQQCIDPNLGGAAPSQGLPVGNCVAVHSPAKAWNALAVGAIDDKDTGGSWSNTAAWSDDSLATFSSFGDPTSVHADREKPELSATGVGVNTTKKNGGFERWSGTSFASPQVAGTYGLQVSANANLLFKPRILRALILANAWRRTDFACTTNVCEIEGVGTLDVYESVSAGVGSSPRYVSNKLEASSCHPQTGCLPPSACKIRQIAFRTGTELEPDGSEHRKRAHIALAWDAYADSSIHRLDADLDLLVFDSAGVLVGHSTTRDNNYEVVRFTPVGGGEYRTYDVHVCAAQVGWNSSLVEQYYSLSWGNPAWGL